MLLTHTACYFFKGFHYTRGNTECMSQSLPRVCGVNVNCLHLLCSFIRVVVSLMLFLCVTGKSSTWNIEQAVPQFILHLCSVSAVFTAYILCPSYLSFISCRSLRLIFIILKILKNESRSFILKVLFSFDICPFVCEIHLKNISTT